MFCVCCFHFVHSIKTRFRARDQYLRLRKEVDRRVFDKEGHGAIVPSLCDWQVPHAQSRNEVRWAESTVTPTEMSIDAWRCNQSQ
jgi:hypothetical protein